MTTLHDIPPRRTLRLALSTLAVGMLLINAGCRSFPAHGVSGNCASYGCNGCSACQLAGGRCSACASQKPTLAQCLKMLVQPCPDYPPGCMPPELGSETNNFFGAMAYQAEEEDFVVYDFQWKQSSDEMTLDVSNQLRRIGPRLAAQPFPVVVQQTTDSDVDEARRAQVVASLREQLTGLVAQGQPVVLVNHLGPTNRVVHLPKTGPKFAGDAMSCYPQLTETASADSHLVVSPAEIQAVLDTLDSRVLIGEPGAEGQPSEAFGLPTYTNIFGGGGGGRGGQNGGGGGNRGGGGGGGFSR